MDVTYKNKHLQKCAENESYSVRKLGKLRSDLYLERIGNLISAECLEAVKFLPGNFHELTGNRKGQWACTLDNPYRLIFVPHEDPIPTDPYGRYIWLEIKGVEIIDIDNYHGK